MTKAQWRQRIRARLKRAGVTRFPALSHHAPNFQGAEQAAQLLRELPMWKRARVVKFDSDPPQLALRRAALKEKKIIYLTIPRLRGERCFIELDPERLGRRILRASSLTAARRLGRLLGPQEVQLVDLVVCGSVAVSRDGARLGPGGGYSDLAYALLRSSGKIREHTPVVTTVHPLQVTDRSLPMDLHDIPVDFVITPTQMIAVPSSYARPSGLIWGLLTDERISAIPLLRGGKRELRDSSTPGHR
jgi:5-formyltetrahydrofolate cyclo-ligase